MINIINKSDEVDFYKRGFEKWIKSNNYLDKNFIFTGHRNNSNSKIVCKINDSEIIFYNYI